MIAVGVGRIPDPKRSEQKAVAEGPPPCTARRQLFFLQVVTADGPGTVTKVVVVVSVLDVEDEDGGRETEAVL